MKKYKIYKTESPCKDCIDRSVECHSKCSKYSLFKTKLAKENSTKSTDVQITAYINETICRNTGNSKKYFN